MAFLRRLTALNTSISGTLIKTLPPASSCYTGNPFDSTQNCSSVQNNWALASSQANTPEGIDYPIYANNSWLPTDVPRYQAGKDCEIGGPPIYVVNATTEDQIATAMEWATESSVDSTSGEILTANADQNPDLLWATRGGGPGTCGVVTEFVLQAYPAISSFVAVNLEVIPLGSENDTTTTTVFIVVYYCLHCTAIAAWNALAILFQSIPDLMDTGIAGAMTAATGCSARALSGLRSAPPGVYFSQAFYGYKISTPEMATVIFPLIEKMKDISDGSLSLNYTVTDVYPTYLDIFYAGDPGEDPAGQVPLLSTHLLGRAQLSDVSMEKVAAYLQRALASQGGGWISHDNWLTSRTWPG
ncbi:uncharacterized protein EAE97_011654 [Botrytis byssoidea]|uniref:Berberine/berberine-like domain-containing protein n=1 Tax=Botrytis byssoidea TaxID=139641 RepID=A0A9P5HVX6_9HELO|nr:uncharacterized protein EAE97_011654 [Botrytis byssoidea]KAF7919322.1 hypothetical protein EAE97_011654 [Botrytis byssoidea]